MKRKVKQYVMENCAEDGTHCSRFTTFGEANEALEDLTGTTFVDYWDYLGRGSITLAQIESSVESGASQAVTDDWGRRIRIYKDC
jgi:hypothetical protein